MGHNISQRKAVSQALALSLGQFREQPTVLVITCQACAGTREVRLSVLADRYGFDLLLGTAILRLRCRRCGEAPSTIHLAKKPGAARLTLRGPGAF